MILAGVFMLQPCIMNIKPSKSMTYIKLNLPNLYALIRQQKNFPIIFKTTSIKFLEIMATPLELQQTNDDLTIPFFRTNRCQKSFKYHGSKIVEFSSQKYH